MVPTGTLRGNLKGNLAVGWDLNRLLYGHAENIVHEIEKIKPAHLHFGARLRQINTW